VRGYSLFCGIAGCGFEVNGNTAKQHNGSTTINPLTPCA